MPGHIITELTSLAGPSSEEELENIQVDFLEHNILTQRNHSSIKNWLEENDFEVFTWAVTDRHFKLLESFLKTAKDYNIDIGTIINTTLSNYTS